MMRAVSPWSFVAALAVVSLSACSRLSPEKEAVVVKARSIREFPVLRGALVASLGLERQRGERFDGAVIDGWRSHWETWRHPTGLVITAYDHDYRHDRHGKVTRESIDRILDSQPRRPVDFIGTPSMAAPCESFAGFVVKDGGKMVFQSDEP